jgi:branched-chain amino acid transport system permease protein
MIFSGIETGSFYALAALGIIIIFRTSITTNFAQGVIGMFNAFMATEFYYRFGYSTVESIILAIVTSIIMGILIDILIIRHARKVNPVSKQIITLGLIMIIMGITPMIFGTTNRDLKRIIPSGQIDFGSLHISYNSILNIILVFIIMFVLFIVLQYTKWGLAVRVTASNEYTARLMGVPTKMVTMIIWALAASLSTLASIMLAPSNSVEVNMMGGVQVNALIACVLGGFQTFYGPVIAAYIIGISSNLIVFYISDTWGEPILYIFILIFILIKPNGLIGKKLVKKV